MSAGAVGEGLSPRTRRELAPWVWPAVFLVLGSFAVFVLPWQVPFSRPQPSPSYTFGYNNSAALAGVAVLLGLTWIWRMLARGGAALTGLVCDQSSGSKALLATTVGVAALVCGLIWAWWSYLPFAHFGESRYFLIRLDAMFMGLRPYRDFDFGYGPAMLYPPFALHRVTGAALDTAHILNLLGFMVAGYLVLWRIVARLRLPASWRIGLVVAAGVLGLNLSLAPIYTPLRFLWALFSVLEMDEILRAGGGRTMRASVMAGAYCLGGLLISPDTGLVTVVGMAVYLGWSAVNRRRSDAVLLVCPVAALAAAGLAFGPESFKYLLTFGGGYMNLPIPPAPYIFVLGIAAFWTLPQLAAGAFQAPNPLRPLAAGLTAVCGLMLPAALGRCDPGHVFWNGLPLFLVTAVLASGAHYGELFKDVADRRALLNSLPPTKNSVEAVSGARGSYLRFPWSKSMLFAPDTERLLKYDRVATPLGCSEDFDKFLKLTGRYVVDFCFDGSASGGDLKKKLRALESERVVLVRIEEFGHLLPFGPERMDGTTQFLSELYVFPVRWPLRNAPFSFNAVVAYALAATYRKADEFPGYVLMEKVGK